jgi:hypothetical protein
MGSFCGSAGAPSLELQNQPEAEWRAELMRY